MADFLGVTLPPPLTFDPTLIKPLPVMRMVPVPETFPGVLCLTLPWMPSLNHYWRHMILKTPKGPQLRVLISQEGREYRHSVLAHMRALGNPAMPAGSRLAVGLTLCAPNRRQIDIDNRIKAGLDALTHAGVWADDSLIDELTVQRGPIIKGGQVKVTITPLDATLFEEHAEWSGTEAQP